VLADYLNKHEKEKKLQIGMIGDGGMTAGYTINEYRIQPTVEKEASHSANGA
jgi:hypothetical protein